MPNAMRIGVVAVHGVIPQVRHGFQDDVATSLCGALNHQSNGKAWAMTVVLPVNGAANVSDVPTISRVHVSNEPDPNSPTQEFFDVHEAFWSPIDKGKTTLAKVLTWLLTTLFLPFNDFARYRERPLKAVWDVTFIGVAVFIGVFALVVAALISAEAMRIVLCMVGNHSVPTQSCNHALGLMDFVKHILSRLFEITAWRNAFGTLVATLSFILSPFKLVETLKARVVVGLLCGTIGAYLIFQAGRAALFILGNIAEFMRRDGVQLFSRIAWTFGLALLASAFIFVEWNTPANATQGTQTLSWVGVLLIVAVGLFNFGRNYLTWFVTNFFGDVQIYTTRDQNSEFFTLREQILEKVVNTILSVVSGSPSGAPYDRVYILAHSLGSTIAMDALLRLYDMQAASTSLPNPSLSVPDWNRIRGFISFGTSLEKTKYFFNVWNPTPSQDWEQWNAAVYGAIFTAEKNVLGAMTGASGIYWLNCWFFSDFVSDQICTYNSFLLPGDSVSQNRQQIKLLSGQGPAIGRLVAANRGIFGPFPKYLQTHTRYVDNYWFWHPSSPQDTGVVDVLTSAIATISPEVPYPRAVLGAPLLPASPPQPPRTISVSKWSAKLYKSWEVVR
jgi:hypothetical protein